MITEAKKIHYALIQTKWLTVNHVAMDLPPSAENLPPFVQNTAGSVSDHL